MAIDFDSILTQTLSGTTLRIETQLAPDLNIDLGGVFDSSKPSSWFATVAKPRISVISPDGSVLTQVAPYGPPNVQGWVVASLVVLVILAIVVTR